MKKLLLSLLLLTAFQNINSQVVFCPPGAKWNYLFGYAFSGQTTNDKALYLRDSVLNAETVKVIYHTRFFVGCTYNYGTQPYNWGYTLIKQKGDTIFMRNQFTQHQWQILYNYAALPGATWTNTLGAPGSVYYTTLVDSVKTITINNFVLKQLFVTQNYCGPNLNAIVIQTQSTITERIGFNGHLFPFYCNIDLNSICELEPLKAFLCYSDDKFGTKQFTAQGCDMVGMEENAANPFDVTFFPNPSHGTLQLKSTVNVQGEHTYASFTDLQGKEIKRVIVNDEHSFFDISDLNNGMYFVSITKDGDLLHRAKIVKQE